MNQNSSGQRRYYKVGLVAAIALATLACLWAWWSYPRDFLVAYLAAILLPWSISVGSIALVLIVRLTGGRWGEVAWPLLVTFSRMMPVVAVLFVPWLLGLAWIYPWFGGDIFHGLENTENRLWYYRTPFFVGRTVLYFVVWSALGWWPSLTSVRGGELTAALGLIALLLTVTWSTIDWVMSFDPFFTSTLLGVLMGSGAMLAGLSAAIAGVCFWQRWLPGRAVPEKTLADLSSLLLAMLLLWAYFSLSHFLIMWSGNLPDEAEYYLVRSASWWGVVTPLLAVLGFVVPFLCLLSYRFKRSPKMVGSLALSLLVVRAVELAWFILPADDNASAALRWMLMIPALVLAVGVFALAIAWAGVPASPIQQPSLAVAQEEPA